MNGEEAAALEGGEGSDEEDTTFKKMLRSKIKQHFIVNFLHPG